jgi:NadR type nicotinamide-nucleotide adenylyltransferase
MAKAFACGDYSVKRICLHGPESVGKSRLAAQLAAHFGTAWVPEYGRTYCEENGTDLDSAQLLDIAQVQQAMVSKAEHAAAAYGRDMLILDTDPLMTAVWCDMMDVPRDPWFAAFDDVADLYLLCDIDLPWVGDGTRIYGDAAMRERFFAACRKELVAREVAWALVGGRGKARLANALAAIAAHLPGNR